MTAFLAGLAVGVSSAMWIRWDQVMALKEELAATQRHVERNRRWRGIYRHTQPEQTVDP